MYLSLLGNLSLWSVTSNESSLFFGTTKSDAMNQEDKPRGYHSVDMCNSV